MAASPNATTLAYPSPGGDSVMFMNTLTWREQRRQAIKLHPMTSASGRTVLVTSLLYAEFLGKLPKPFLVVCKICMYIVCSMYYKRDCWQFIWNTR